MTLNNEILTLQQLENIADLNAASLIADKLAASIDVRISPLLLSKIFAVLGIFPRELVEKNLRDYVRVSVTSKIAASSKRTPRKASGRRK